jgi:hypothetical protein
MAHAELSATMTDGFAAAITVSTAAVCALTKDKDFSIEGIVCTASRISTTRLQLQSTPFLSSSA